MQSSSILYQGIDDYADTDFDDLPCDAESTFLEPIPDIDFVDSAEVDSDDEHDIPDVDPYKLAELAEATEFDYDQAIINPVIFMQYMNGGRWYDVMAEGTFGLISGAEKSGKTFILSMMCSSYISGTPAINFKFLNREGTMLFFDTEQPDVFYRKTQRRIYDQARIRKKPGNYRAFALRELTPADRLEAIRQIIEKEIQAGTKVSVVVIDGIADCMKDTNDLVESQELAAMMMRWSKIYEVAILGVLHIAKSTGKMRGHLGSELSRKVDFTISVEREDNIYEVKFPLMRFYTPPPMTFMRMENGEITFMGDAAEDNGFDD